jgi:hypothetical protein
MVDGDVSAPDDPGVLGEVGAGELLLAAACRRAASTATIVFGGLMLSPFTDEFCAAPGRTGPVRRMGRDDGRRRRSGGPGVA